MFCTIKKSKMLRRRGEIARRRGPRVFDCSAVAAAALLCVPHAVCSRTESSEENLTREVVETEEEGNRSWKRISIKSK